jgi:NAD(P)H-flavin reductase/hemoglobin-like flavoprotein
VPPQPSDSRTPEPVTPPFFLKEAVSDVAMTYFYAHLFAAEPEISAMFPAAMHVQRRRFYQALCRIIAGLGDTHDGAAAGTEGGTQTGTEAGKSDLPDYLATLGRAHRKFGVRKEHYTAFHAALRATAEKFSPGTDIDEWQTPFDRAAEIMLAAVEQDAASAPAWWTAEVTSHELRTPQVAVLTVQPSQPFAYLPGQHLSVQTPRWPRLWRNYSIANAPRPDGSLTLHVRAVGGGLVSTTLVHHTSPGDMLLLGRSEGPMTADTGSERPVLCLAGGTGLAPIKAIAEAVTGTGVRRDIVLYFGARTESELYDLPALRQLELDCPWLEVIPLTSQERAQSARHGTIPAFATRACWKDRDVYISGPDPMIVMTVAALRELGAPDEQLHYDLPDQTV